MILAAAQVVFMLFIILFLNRQPPMLTELKQRYHRLIKILRDSRDPTWIPVLRPSIITGIYGRKDGVIGSNVNKGYEIYICMDGDDVNSAMYVLIHELAHMSVPEYDHTDLYWENFKKLKAICVQNGLYQDAGSRTYCGEQIHE